MQKPSARHCLLMDSRQTPRTAFVDWVRQRQRTPVGPIDCCSSHQFRGVGVGEVSGNDAQRGRASGAVALLVSPLLQSVRISHPRRRFVVEVNDGRRRLDDLVVNRRRVVEPRQPLSLLDGERTLPEHANLGAVIISTRSVSPESHQKPTRSSFAVRLDARMIHALPSRRIPRMRERSRTHPELSQPRERRTSVPAQIGLPGPRQPRMPAGFPSSGPGCTSMTSQNPGAT